jgi:hypothetical protein
MNSNSNSNMNRNTNIGHLHMISLFSQTQEEERTQKDANTIKKQLEGKILTLDYLKEQATERLKGLVECVEISDMRKAGIKNQILKLQQKVLWSYTMSDDVRMQIFRELGLITQARMRMVCKEFNHFSTSARCRKVYKSNVLCAVFEQPYSSTDNAHNRVDVIGGQLFEAYGDILICTGDSVFVYETQEDKLKSSPYPTQVFGWGIGFVSISVGSLHTVAVTSSGHVYTWGSGKHWVLGHGSERSEVEPRRVIALEEVSVFDVSAGNEHTVVCAAEGDVYTWGSGMMGELGHASDKAQPKPRLVEALKGFRVMQVEAGTWCTLARTLGGKVFSWGYGFSGQLGNGDLVGQDSPQIIRSLSAENIHISGISVGEDHVALCSSYGKLYTYGEGTWGKLGHGNSEIKLIPRLVESFSAHWAEGVACGSQHTLVYTRDGCLYSCGYGISKTQSNVLKTVESFAHSVVGAVCDGQLRSLVWTRDSKVYILGHGESNRVGQGYV